ncbi:MAG TPA: peptidase M23 [Methylophaga aminisulfidivorans]|uniref:Peptidase M23 n=1 Tax=Methylophaga aminisulfidivorans TaxID=230105 RepID=A0A7C1VX84_9GAMM|nr:peptidase M23 [Methylophaga aminisulfidivorans]
MSLCFLLCCISSVTANTNSAERLDDVKSQIKSLDNDLSKKKANREQLLNQLKQQSQQISNSNKELRKLSSQLSDKQTQVKALREQAGIKEKEQQQQLDALYTQIQSAFMHAEPSYLEMLLNQQDVSKISRGSTYFKYFHQARQQEIETIKQSLTKLNEQQKSLLLAQRSLQNLLEKQESQQHQLQRQATNRKQTIAALDKTISTQDERLNALKSEEKNLQTLLDSLAKKVIPKAKKEIISPSVKPNTPFSRQIGRLKWPVSGKLLASYGSSRNLGKLTWQGIVIKSATGNEVKATAAGRVIFANWLRGFGLLIIIDHGEKYMTLYGNNESLLREVGDYVNAGDVIAQSGEQGIRGLTGLYFEIRHRGNPTNPMKWLAKQG